MSQKASNHTHYQAIFIVRDAIDEATRMRRILGDVERQLKRIDVHGNSTEKVEWPVGERSTAMVLLQSIHKEVDMMKEDIQALIQSMNDMITSSDSLSVKDE